MPPTAAATTLAHDALLPRPPGGNGAGALLALAVHAALLLALTVSVDWRARAPEAVGAELWASVPQTAAPRAEAPPVPSPAPAPAPAPTPAPSPPAPAPAPPRDAARRPDPEIAIERERRAADARRKAEAEAQQAAALERQRAADKKQAQERQAEADRRKAEAAADQQRKLAEQQKVDKQKADKLQADKQARAEEERLAKQRSENLRRMMGQAAGNGDATATGSAARNAAPSAAYTGKLATLIRRSIVYTGSTSDPIVAEVEVRAAPGGTILSRRLVKSSGVREWDESVLRAIDKTARLPPDTDGKVPSALTFVFRPNE